MPIIEGATPGAILSATPGATPRQPPVNEGATHTPYTPSVAPALRGGAHAAGDEVERGKMSKAMTQTPDLTPAKFDRITKPTGKLWGLPAIAETLGTSVDTARKLAKLDETCPIYVPGGRYFAFRSELMEWLRSHPANRGVV